MQRFTVDVVKVDDHPNAEMLHFRVDDPDAVCPEIDRIKSADRIVLDVDHDRRIARGKVRTDDVRDLLVDPKYVCMSVASSEKPHHYEIVLFCSLRKVEPAFTDYLFKVLAGCSLDGITADACRGERDFAVKLLVASDPAIEAIVSPLGQDRDIIDAISLLFGC